MIQRAQDTVTSSQRPYRVRQTQNSAASAGPRRLETGSAFAQAVAHRPMNREVLVVQSVDPSLKSGRRFENTEVK